MRMTRMFKGFASNDDGAVTVDWVVLTAGVAGLAALAMAGLQGKMSSIGQRAADFLSSQTISTTF